MQLELMYVGITGTFAAGKGEVVRMLRKQGFFHYSFGDFIREEAKKRGYETTIPELARLGNELRIDHGTGYIAQQLINRLQEEAPKYAVLESIRSLGELKELRRLPGFLLLSIDAPREVRYERMQRRARHDGINSLDDFCRWEDAQLEGNETGQQLLAVMDQADIKVVNIGNLEELEASIREQLGL